MKSDIIIRCALESKYQGINFDALLDVINATPNNEVATLKLLGLYQRPILLTGRNTHPTYDNRPGKFVIIDYNEYQDRVTYKGTYIDISTRFFATEDEALAMANGEPLEEGKELPGVYSRTERCPYEAKIKYTRTTENDCSSEKWNKIDM